MLSFEPDVSPVEQFKLVIMIAITSMTTGSNTADMDETMSFNFVSEFSSMVAIVMTVTMIVVIAKLSDKTVLKMS